jgi:hypothetical protein
MLDLGYSILDPRYWMLDKNVGEASGLDDRGWKPLPQLSGACIAHRAKRLPCIGQADMATT